MMTTLKGSSIKDIHRRDAKIAEFLFFFFAFR